MRSCFLFLLFIVAALLGLTVPAQAGDYLPPQLVRYPLPKLEDEPQFQPVRKVVQYECSGGQCKPVATGKDSLQVHSVNAPYLPPCPCQTSQGYCACGPAKANANPKQAISSYESSGCVEAAASVRDSCSSFGSGSCGLFSGERRFRPVRGLLGLLFGGCGG